MRITRRDAPDLVVLRADDLEAKEEGVALASRLMRAYFRASGDMAVGLRDIYGWSELLSDDEHATFASDMLRQLWAAAGLGHYEALCLELARWRETAEAYASGMPRGRGADLTWLEQPVIVEEP